LHHNKALQQKHFVEFKTQISAAVMAQSGLKLNEAEQGT
jgi:hypothetical protein